MFRTAKGRALSILPTNGVSDLIVTQNELAAIRREIQKCLGFNDPAYHLLTCDTCGLLTKSARPDLPVLRPRIPEDVGEPIKDIIERFYENPYKLGAVDELWRRLGGIQRR